MIDLHTHTLFSDGELLPSELVYRAKVNGYSAICLADHADISIMDFTIPRIVRVAKQLTLYYRILVLPGAELTFNPPEILKSAVRSARKLGAKIVVVHGETTAEPVPPGTNRAGILAGADVLAHPGKITPGDAKLAADKNTCLEITARAFHSKTNGYVYSIAKRFGAKLVFNTDTHSPENLIDGKGVRKILKIAGIPYKEFLTMQQNASDIISSIV